MSRQEILAALTKLGEDITRRIAPALKGWEGEYEKTHKGKNLMDMIDAFNDGRGAEALSGMDPKKVDPAKVKYVQAQINQGQAIYCAYIAMGGSYP